MIFIFVGFFVRFLEDELLEIMVMVLDSLFKLCKGILEIMFVIVEYFCDRWDVFVVGVMGFYLDVCMGIVEMFVGLYFIFVWDLMKDNVDEDFFI